ncbi:MAG: hypothetical protein ACRELF_09310 [Gemmataceae bacterium]
MLDLNSPRWANLWHLYSGDPDWPTTATMIHRLRDAREEAKFDDAMADLWDSVLHQNDLCPAALAVVPHLLDIAERVRPQWGVKAVSLAGRLENARQQPWQEALEAEWLRAVGDDLLAEYHAAIMRLPNVVNGLAAQLGADSALSLSIAILNGNGCGGLAEQLVRAFRREQPPQ